MILKTLKTQNFRNLVENPPEFHEGINVLFGDNAAGKTNTLEAIYLFATGKSFRTRNEKDFIRHGEDFARVEIALNRHIGAPAIPIASDGDVVSFGDKIANAAEGLSIAMHASISGRVTLVDGKIIIDKV